MQTSLARRQRHRRALQRRPKAGGSTLGRIASSSSSSCSSSRARRGTGVVFAVGAYNHYAAGLPDPKEALTNLEFEQQTIIYDRTGKIELARLGDLKREVVTFDELPAEMIDATTAIEDKDFWSNPGFDPAGIVSAGLDTLSGQAARRITITQQLVRARLLPPEAFEGSTYERKMREIIQSIRLTQAYPGEEGKKKIITAYLNQNFYGNQSYGVQAAAKGYFGKSLADLTLAQYAILAAIPQSPTKFDLDAQRRGGLPRPEHRRGRGMHELQARRPARPRDRPAPEQRPRPDEDAQHADRHQAHRRRVRRRQGGAGRVIPPVAAQWKAPHFVWQVRRALGEILCPDTPDRLPRGRHRRLPGHHDARLEDAEERREVGLRRGPRAERQGPAAILGQPQDPGAAWGWILGLRGHNIHNAAAGVIDYRTGEVLAYAGRRSYTSKGNKKFQPQFDVLADGWRQPGSAIKPIDYPIGIDDETLTAATMFMDVATNFGGGFTPIQADKLERGPVRLRSALQFSLNVPAIKATIISGLDHVFERTKDFGLDLPEDRASRSCRWASARSRSTRSTCSARTARSPTAACRCRAR